MQARLLRRLSLVGKKGRRAIPPEADRRACFRHLHQVEQIDRIVSSKKIGKDMGFRGVADLEADW
jgi:hypothetical protein